MAGFRIEQVSRAQFEEIEAVTAAAFGRPEEARLVRLLRDNGDAVAELAAVGEGGVVGHILFSLLFADPPTLHFVALAPVSVKPELQKRGIGSALIREGLKQCRGAGFSAVALVGEPDYYCRFGFSVDAARTLKSVYAGPYFQAVELVEGALAGGPWQVTFPRAFAYIE